MTRAAASCLDRSKAYVFLLRDREGAEFIARRAWNGRAWKTERLYGASLVGVGPWRVLLGDRPFWQRGPWMVLEVPACSEERP